MRALPYRASYARCAPGSILLAGDNRLLHAGCPRAMTLIELILVMTLLTLVIGFSLPALSGFFAGRRTLEEARRLLALTHFARSEAISQAFQAEVWLDPENNRYGFHLIKPEASQVGINLKGQGDPESTETAPKMEYSLADGLSMEIDESLLDEQGRAKITFLPDGTIEEGSLESAIIRKTGDGEYTLEKRPVGTGYQIR